MALDSDNLEAFYACAQTRHFTKAAERLFITQSALSQRIKNLEETLGTTLLIRDRAGIRLTAEGEDLLRYYQIKDHLETEVLERIQSRHMSGVIRIGAHSSVCRSVILPSLSPLLNKNSSLQLRLLNRELYELKPLLKSGEIDYVILDETLDDENLTSHKLGEERNVMIQKRNYSGPEIYLDHDEADTTTIKYLRKKSGQHLKRHFLDDIYGIIDGVRAGLGRAVVPLHLVKDLKDCEVLSPKHIVLSPVVLHYWRQPYYSLLHNEIVAALTVNCGKFM